MGAVTSVIAYGAPNLINHGCHWYDTALMLVGDWCKFPNRERAFELRQMEAGDLTICKTGQLYTLYNHMDEQIKLFMFGGYD